MPILTLNDIEQFIQEEIKQQQPHLKSKLCQELKLEFQPENEVILASLLLKIYNEHKKNISTEVFMIPMDNLFVCQKQFFSIINFRVAQQWVTLKNDIQETTNITNIMGDDEAWNEFMRTQEKSDEKLVLKISMPEMQRYKDAINKDYRIDMRHCKLKSKQFQINSIIQSINKKFENNSCGEIYFDTSSFEQIVNVSKYFPNQKDLEEIQEQQNISENLEKVNKRQIIKDKLLLALFEKYKFLFRPDQKMWLHYLKCAKKQNLQYTTENLRQTLIQMLCLLKREMIIGSTITEKEKAFYKFKLLISIQLQFEQSKILVYMENAKCAERK